MVATVLALPGSATANDLDRLIAKTIQTNRAASHSQKRVEKYDDAAQELRADYRTTLEQVESLKTYNDQIVRMLASQERELTGLEVQLQNATVIGRRISPLMVKMLDTLESFVELDVPFLLNERRDRVASLRELLDRADVTDAEKYRRLLEAYQIENEYGRTIEAYTADLELGGQVRTVNFLRVGRMTLVYQTLDHREAGVWDPVTFEWTSLPSHYRSSIKKGLRIARKQSAPDLIRLPVHVP